MPHATHAIILAGGSGTRFWPASRADRPKQLLPLAPGGQSLITATIERLDGLVPRERIWIVTSDRQASPTRAALHGVLDPGQVLVEPEARNTAPSILLGCAHVEALDPGAACVVLPADHVIRGNPASFRSMVERGLRATHDHEVLVTFGIAPTYPATGYGYIKRADPLDDNDSPPLHRVESFHEKPDLATATRWLTAGDRLWNSGMFVWTAKALRSAMREAGQAQMLGAFDALVAAHVAESPDPIHEPFTECPALSIDHALLEVSDQIAVVGCDLDWTDVGSFASLDAVAPADETGNAVARFGSAEVLLHDCRANHVYADGQHTTVLLGCEDLIVVQVEDATLVCPRSEAERIKDVVAALRARGRSELL